jgi:hypothetical protein
MSETTTTRGGFAGDPAAALAVTGSGGCGSSAKAEAVASGAGCCG